jgi:hypothetical protein
MESVICEAWREPLLERETPDLPELPRDLLLLGGRQRAPPSAGGDGCIYVLDRTPADIVGHLGISRDAVYTWIRRGYLPARRGPGGRTYVPFTAGIESESWQRIATSPQPPVTIKTKALQHITGDAL